ncbi:Bax inhibitor-1/YccA family protein [Sulfurimonas sp. HSL-1716]|uniref:Bax inhibitor-1/YccA family protein n=1 Tax=Hydrocurvibacter sulfurireducens TaxID=3131937 RepID=UPI0031FA092C
MGLYDRDYARSTSFGFEAVRRTEAQTVSFVKETYKLFAASMLAAAVGAYVGIPFAGAVAASYWFIAIPWMLFGMFGLNMVKNKPGINMIALFAFTFVSGIIITPLLSHILGMKGGGALVANAFLMTSALFGALSFFAIKTTKDFTTYSKPLIIAFFVILGFSLINVFFIHSPAIFLFIQAAFLLVISVMVIHDTQNVISGAYETPMDGAIALYLDFFNLFITLLQLFGIFGSSDD